MAQVYASDDTTSQFEIYLRLAGYAGAQPPKRLSERSAVMAHRRVWAGCRM